MAEVDVIIPTRNRLERTLAAIASVRGQTFADWHLYVVDDASDDGSVDAISASVAGDPRITVLRLDERGRAARAREAGFRAGTSPWVATLDSDDLWHPDRLSRQLAAAGEHDEPVDVVLAWHCWLRSDGTPRVTRTPSGAGRVSPMLSNNVDIMLARRELIDRIGSFTGDEHTPLHADENIDFFIRLLAAGQTVVVPHVLAWCYDHVGPRTSDALPPETLEQILLARRPLLEPWPADLGGLLCLVGARHLAVGHRGAGVRRTFEGLRAAPWPKRRALARQYLPHLVKQVLRPPRVSSSG